MQAGPHGGCGRFWVGRESAWAQNSVHCCFVFASPPVIIIGNFSRIHSRYPFGKIGRGRWRSWCLLARKWRILKASFFENGPHRLLGFDRIPPRVDPARLWGSLDSLGQFPGWKPLDNFGASVRKGMIFGISVVSFQDSWERLSKKPGSGVG